jgi:TetR/AcrR family transcriptional repressor of nem operon
MARPRTFEETAALDAAIGCFWRRGYEATSVRDLAAAMGISGTSLYNTFEDKHALFVRALERYMDGAARERIARLEKSLPPKAAIRKFIGDVVDRSVDDPNRRGCFLINSALEVAPHDPKLGAEIAARLGEIEQFFRRTIVAGQADGTITRARDPSDMARLLLGILLGIRHCSTIRTRRGKHEHAEQARCRSGFSGAVAAEGRRR